MSALDSLLSDLLIQPTRSLGGLYPDVVVEEAHQDDLEITEHPVEQGASINDHAFKKPKTVVIRGGSTNMELYDKLLELQEKREPFDITTGKRLYENMLLKGLSVVTDVNSENVLQFVAECREVIIVATQVSSVPARSRQADPATTGGTENTGQKQPSQRESILHGGLGGIL